MSIVSQTAQGTVLSMASNILAQIMSSYKHDTPLSFDITPVLKFALFNIISAPPNILWQRFLEDRFPTTVWSPTRIESEKTHEKPPVLTQQMSKTNVFIKFLLDQTLGAVVNTLMFLAFMGYANAPVTASGRLGAQEAVKQEVNAKFWPILLDGYKLWPFFSLISFLFIPVHKRVVMGALVGVGWNIYLSLMVS